MPTVFLFCCAVAAMAQVYVPPALPIELLGVARWAGAATDLSGEAGTLENGEPHNRFGGISALEYTGEGQRYLALADRGPDDGATGYRCRFHVLEIALQPAGPEPVAAQLLSTHLLVDAAQHSFVGAATAFRPMGGQAGRLDPEGLRQVGSGTLFVSDEYGPQLLQFDCGGRLVAQLQVPSHLQVAHPAGDKDTENQANRQGRASNRGMEGLAVSPDGRRLYGLLQGPLLQDGQRHESGKAAGRFCRLLEYDRITATTREFVYPLHDSAHGLNEILAVNDHEFLVIERDSQSGSAARFRRLLRISIAGATDISGICSLPEEQLPAGVVPVSQEVFLDFLDPAFGLVGAEMPEKIEGLSWGPPLADGRATLLVAVDNDFEVSQPTLIWAFAIPKQLLQRTQPADSASDAR